MEHIIIRGFSKNAGAIDQLQQLLSKFCLTSFIGFFANKWQLECVGEIDGKFMADLRWELNVLRRNRKDDFTLICCGVDDCPPELMLIVREESVKSLPPPEVEERLIMR